MVRKCNKNGALKDRAAAMSIIASNDPPHKRITMLDDFLVILNDSIKSLSATTASSTTAGNSVQVV